MSAYKGDVVRELKDLLSSPGWEVLVERMKARREIKVRSLLFTSDLHQIVRAQGAIEELDQLMQFPQDEIRNELLKEKRKGEENGV